MLKIDLYTDIICPWCLIGEKRLDNILSRDLVGASITIERHPIQLLPDLPEDGVETLVYLRSRLGVSDPRSVWERPEREARNAGIALDLSRQKRLYPTIHAHTLIRHARSRGTQHALASDITRGYFLDGLRIADPQALTGVATRHGFTAREVPVLLSSDTERRETVEAATRSARRGVRSVPTFVIDGQAYQPESEEALSVLLRSSLARNNHEEIIR